MKKLNNNIKKQNPLMRMTCGAKNLLARHWKKLLALPVIAGFVFACKTPKNCDIRGIFFSFNTILSSLLFISTIHTLIRIYCRIKNTIQTLQGMLKPLMHETG